MNVIEKHGDKKIFSNDNLFYAYVSHYFEVKDKDEKNPIPYIRIREADQDSDRVSIDLYFNSQRIENEMRMYSNTSSSVFYSVTKMFQLATFVRDLQEFIQKNPHILTEAKYH